jgi:hypothetical protein
MRFSVHAFAPGVVVLALVSASCSVPTDKSKDIQVLLRVSDTLAAHGVLGRGTRDSLFASAFRVDPNGDTIPLTNVDFSWWTSDQNVATIAGGTSGAAEITGVNEGLATITARAVAFQDANAGQTLVRVTPAFVIDSVRPTNIRYGAKVTVYGVGVGNIFSLALGGGDLISDPFSFAGSAAGLSSRRYWVPSPAASAKPTYFLFGGGQFVIGQAGDSVTVDPRDIFEPDTAVPGVIDLNGSGGPRSLGGLNVLYYNPALYFEPVATGSSDIDWDRFDQSDNQAATILVNSQSTGDTAFAYVSDSLLKCGPLPTDICYQTSGWLYTAGLQWCNNAFYSYAQPRVPTFVVAFMKWPTPRLHLVQFYAREGRYAVTAVRGYLPANRDAPPDRFEDNQLCWQADANFQDSVGPTRKQIVVGAGSPFGDSTLTTSQPYDVDFYRFRVQPAAGPGDTVLTLQIKSRPQHTVDPSDVDLYLYDTGGNFIASSENLGSTEAITVTGLAPGEYYAIAVDYAGQPACYSMCIVKGFGCAPPGAVSPARVTAKARPPAPPRAPAPPVRVITTNLRQLSPRP